jgi:hypothetical protein
MKMILKMTRTMYGQITWNLQRRKVLVKYKQTGN